MLLPQANVLITKVISVILPVVMTISAFLSSIGSDRIVILQQKESKMQFSSVQLLSCVRLSATP